MRRKYFAFHIFVLYQFFYNKNIFRHTRSFFFVCMELVRVVQGHAILLMCSKKYIALLSLCLSINE